MLTSQSDGFCFLSFSSLAPLPAPLSTLLSALLSLVLEPAFSIVFDLCYTGPCQVSNYALLRQDLGYLINGDSAKGAGRS